MSLNNTGPLDGQQTNRMASKAEVPAVPVCDYDLAAAYVVALTGSLDTVMDWRCLSETDAGLHGQTNRGTLSDVWPWITGWNSAGYGCFVNVSEMDGHGRELANVAAVRAHVVDLDNLDAEQQRGAAAAWSPAPTFQVETSPGRFHVYWCLSEPYADNERFTALQRRIRHQWNGDRSIIDATRILRLPGTWNRKRAVPHLVRCEALAGYGQPLTVDQLEGSLSHVVVVDGRGDRHELGVSHLAAPSLDWLKRALDLANPNDLDRPTWISLTSAIKQAGWSLTDEATLRGLWDDWCARYDHDDPAEDEKQWRSIRDSQLGWPSLVARIPPLKAEIAFGASGPPLPFSASATPLPVPANDKASRKPITATAYSWRDPRTIPPRAWVLGRWVLAGEVTTLVAPGGSGKSTLGAGIALSLATARALLGQRVYDGPHAVWLLNLEDGIDELERQVGAATIKHGIERDDCGDRLFLDSGIVQPLCTATETRDGFTIDEATFEHLTATIQQRRIRAVVVDPFISSHTVSEASNEAIDAIVKRWKRLAQETGCAVVLVHHTKKLGGREATAEDGRGAVALRDASRVVLALNPMTEADGKKLGVFDPTARRSIVRVDMGKSNRAPAERATWFMIEGQCLGNATPSRPADNVGVAVEWKRPDLLHGFTSDHLRALQQRLGAGALRVNVQATDWVGKIIAEIAELDVENDEHKASIKAVLAAWINDGSLAIEHRDNGKGGESPFVICGRSVDAMPGQMDPR